MSLFCQFALSSRDDKRSTRPTCWLTSQTRQNSQDQPRCREHLETENPPTQALPAERIATRVVQRQKLMYNPTRQMWQSDGKPRANNPMVFWWGMKEVSSVGNHGRGNPEDSWRTNTLPMPTGLAPPKHHGVFLFGSDRQGALADGLNGLNPRNTDTAIRPAACRPALIKRLVKHRIHGGNKVLCISELIRPAHLVAFVFLRQFKVNEDEQNDGARWSIHPWRTYVQIV